MYGVANFSRSVVQTLLDRGAAVNTVDKVSGLSRIDIRVQQLTLTAVLIHFQLK